MNAEKITNKVLNELKIRKLTIFGCEQSCAINVVDRKVARATNGVEKNNNGIVLFGHA